MAAGWRLGVLFLGISFSAGCADTPGWQNQCVVYYLLGIWTLERAEDLGSFSFFLELGNMV